MAQSDREYFDAQLKMLKDGILRSHRHTATLLKAHKIALQLTYSTFFFNMGEENSKKWTKNIRDKAEKAPGMAPDTVKELESIFTTAQRLAKSYGKGPKSRAAKTPKHQSPTKP